MKEKLNDTSVAFGQKGDNDNECIASTVFFISSKWLWNDLQGDSLLLY